MRYISIQPPFSHGRSLSKQDRAAFLSERTGAKETEMNRILKSAVLSAVVGATALTTMTTANADDWRWRHHRHHHSNGDALAAGVLGLAAGAIIGGALASPPPDYYEPRYVVREPTYYEPRYVVRRAPVRQYYRSGYGLEPWTRAWYEYCSDRYRSFDARTGTFTGYDGEQHFCAAN
jgi:hypothetical protein